MQALTDLVQAAASQIDAASDLAALDAVRVAYLGKKGELTSRLKGVSKLPVNDRPSAGQEINKAKQDLQSQINTRRERLENDALEAKLVSDAVDVTLPGRGRSIGGRHPVTRAMARIETIFREAGFGVRSGPEIEDDFHNFTALNFPENHPARALQDTFFLSDGMLLRWDWERLKPPLPVLLKRLAAPRLVFIFGIVFSTLKGLATYRTIPADAGGILLSVSSAPSP